MSCREWRRSASKECAWTNAFSFELAGVEVVAPLAPPLAAVAADEVADEAAADGPTEDDEVETTAADAVEAEEEEIVVVSALVFAEGKGLPDLDVDIMNRQT